MRKIISMSIDLPEVRLIGDLTVPDHSKGLVLFSHGSGSGRLSPRNRYVAEVLVEFGFATLLFDLLTVFEDLDEAMRFDIDLLTERLVAVTKWVIHHEAVEGLPVGYFGASTGAASAIRAASRLPKTVTAVVSRGGRPDLAMEALLKLRAPTLLIVGSLDTMVIDLNQRAFRQMRGVKKMEVVEGATHLFEEQGTLTEVARLAGEWFEHYLTDMCEDRPADHSEDMLDADGSNEVNGLG